jgi:hypothetical protein
MSRVGERGFTVVEVSLFLAITGMLFLIAFLGTANTIRSVRFGDSGRATTAFLQRQYDDIINGLNQRTGAESCVAGNVIPGSQPAGTSGCLLLGKLVIFQVNSPVITTYDVIGTEPANVNYSQTDTQLISAFQPRVVTSIGVGTYRIPWEANISGTKRLSDNQGVNGLLLIRSPKSSRIVSYTYKPTAVPALDLSPVVNSAANTGQTANFCIKNVDGQGLPAKIEVTNAPTQQAVQVTFDADSGGNECNGI